MRLWHIDLIDVLPRQQLLGQWRELNSVFKNQNRHILIDFVYDYPIDDLYNYSMLVAQECLKRKYKINLNNFFFYFKDYNIDYMKPIFYYKMNSRYLKQCYYNLQEKYDCGGISQEDWDKIYQKVGKIINESKYF